MDESLAHTLGIEDRQGKIVWVNPSLKTNRPLQQGLVAFEMNGGRQLNNLSLGHDYRFDIEPAFAQVAPFDITEVYPNGAKLVANIMALRAFDLLNNQHDYDVISKASPTYAQLTLLKESEQVELLGKMGNYLSIKFLSQSPVANNQWIHMDVPAQVIAVTQAVIDELPEHPCTAESKAKNVNFSMDEFLQSRDRLEDMSDKLDDQHDSFDMR